MPPNHHHGVAFEYDGLYFEHQPHIVAPLLGYLQLNFLYKYIKDLPATSYNEVGVWAFNCNLLHLSNYHQNLL